MSDREGSSSREERLDSILDSFIAAITRGEEPDVDEILARNPDLREPLQKRFRGYLEAQSDLLKIAPAHRSQTFEGRVLGDFVLIREIGSGGMGIVFEAEQIPLDRKVALKLLPAYRSLDPRQVERFRREASATAGLNHPGIVPVHSVGEAEGTHYIAMDLVDGEGLNRLLERLEDRSAEEILGERVADLFQGSHVFSAPSSANASDNEKSTSEADRSPAPNSPSPTNDSSPANEAPLRGDATYVAWSATIALKAARALHHAHANGIIHRDVKPGNILVRGDGSPVLVDFGLAYREGAASMTVTGEFLGSFHYVSPEQASSGASPLDHRTDVYSLGVTLYEMLSLRVPFHKGTQHAVIDQILTREPPPLKKINPAVPRDLATIVAKAIEKDRNHRYETADAMADDLQAFLHNRPIRAKPAGAVTRVMKFTQRNRMLMGSVAFVLVMAVVISIGALFWWIGQEKRFSRQQISLRAQESALLEERTDDLLRKLRPLVEGRTPELAYLDLMKAIRGTRGNDGAQKRIIRYTDTLRQKGLVASATRLLEELLAAEPSADVAARAHNVLGNCRFYYLQVGAAGEHWQRAAALAAEGGPAAHEARLNTDLLRLCTPTRFGLIHMKNGAGDEIRISPGYTTCVDIDFDGIDEIVASCHGERRPQFAVIGWSAKGDLETRPIPFDWSCGIELGRIEWFHRRCDGPGAPEFFFVASSRGSRKGLLSMWRRNAPSEALALCWSHPFDSCAADMACGDIDGDGHDEICMATDTRKLYVIDGTEKEAQEIIPVLFEKSDDEDISGLAVADLEGDGAAELLVVTSGHHRFGLFRGRLEEGRFAEKGELCAGVLNGMFLLSGVGPGPSSLIAARGFTPHREDLDAKIDPRFDRSGFYRISRDASHWKVESLWSPPREMGFWFAPRDPVVGCFAESANPAESAKYFVIAFLNWRKGVEGSHCLENAGGVFLQPDRSRAGGWRGTAFTGQFLMATGQLDEDPSSEIVLYNGSVMHTMGVSRPPHDRPPRVIGAAQPSGNHSNFRAMDMTGIKLIDLAAAIVDGESVVRPFAAAVQGLVDQAQFVLAQGVLDSWQWGDEERSVLFTLVHADLDLARGDYDTAAAAYTDLVRARTPVEGGLEMGGLSFDDRRSLAEKLLSGGTLLLDERFEDEETGRLVVGPGGGTLTLQSDRIGQYGGRYERGRFGALRCGPAKSDQEEYLFTTLTPNPSSLWDGTRPFRLSFKVFVSRLFFASSFVAKLVPAGSVEIPDRSHSKAFVCCILSHARNSMSQEGDRYMVNFNFPGRAVNRTGRFAAEFVPDHWLDVEMEYIPALGIAHLFVRHVDRSRNDPPLARSDVTAIEPPRGGQYALQFLLQGFAVRTDDQNAALEVFVDEVRFEVFD